MSNKRAVKNTLLVDIGNTRLKWQFCDVADSGQVVLDGSEDSHFEAITHVGKPTSQVLSELEQSWREAEQQPQQVFIACVSNVDLVAEIDALSQSLFSVKAVSLQSEQQFGDVTNGYLFAHRLGVDRWLGMLAARARFPNKHIIVVSSGSAVTVDALRADGDHLGGVIFPGIRLQQQSLFNQTANLAILAKLNADESTKTRTVWADHTKAAISGGTIFSVAGGVEKIISTMQQRFANEALENTVAEERTETVIVFTGGDAELVMQHMDAELQSCRVHCSNLVFEGMRLMAQQGMATLDSSGV